IVCQLGLHGNLLVRAVWVPSIGFTTRAFSNAGATGRLVGRRARLIDAICSVGTGFSVVGEADGTHRGQPVPGGACQFVGPLLTTRAGPGRTVVQASSRRRGWRPPTCPMNGG